MKQDPFDQKPSHVFRLGGPKMVLLAALLLLMTAFCVAAGSAFIASGDVVPGSAILLLAVVFLGALYKFRRIGYRVIGGALLEDQAFGGRRHLTRLADVVRVDEHRSISNPAAGAPVQTRTLRLWSTDDAVPEHKATALIGRHAPELNDASVSVRPALVNTLTLSASTRRRFHGMLTDAGLKPSDSPDDYPMIRPEGL